MANKFSKGHTFVPGEVVDPDDLNNLVDLALPLAALIDDQITESPLQPTSQVLVKTAAGNLRKRAVSTFPPGVTSVDFSAAPVTVFNDTVTGGTGDAVIALSLANQAKNKVLAGPITGSAVEPAFRVLVPPDTSFPTITIAANNIDWSLGNVFTKTLPTGTSPNTFTFSNVDDGQSIRVRFKQNTAGNAVVNWNPTPLTLIWAGGTEPELLTVGDGFGVYVFTAITDISSGIMRIHGYMETSGGVIGLGTQAANKFLAGPVSGAAATPTFRPIAPDDLAGFVDLAATATPLILDCTQGNVFKKVLDGTNAPFTLRLNNGLPGQRVTVYLIQNASPWGSTVSWTTNDSGGAIQWPGGINHTMTTGAAGSEDIVNFLCMGSGQYYGTFNKDFKP